MRWRDGAGARFAGLARGGFGRIAPRRLRSVARRMRRAVTSAMQAAPGAFPTSRPRDGAAVMLRGGWHHAVRLSTERMRHAWHVRHHPSPRASLRVAAVTGRRVAHGFGPEIRLAGAHLPARRTPMERSRRVVARDVPLIHTALRAGAPAMAASRRVVAPHVASGRSGPHAWNGAHVSSAASARPVAPVVPGRAVGAEATGLAAAAVRPETRFAAPERMDLGRWLGGLFGDEARRPPSGVTGYDTRMSPVFPGRKPGF
ncbi:hypothetical protein ACMV_28390 [Acidiphilium multivorum AIU301]|uniref:Uncharacterized protein n=1 Tax=Acidiphilium multivorum (strain DSM 11245 / JCM 8867 / NBRC 100883 / AIU 301) TaxID=926570 RepID=F0J445_ACIMA|nr:hypothetical protein ACMV_28390 [Acidiphilium multivorum AIU301]